MLFGLCSPVQGLLNLANFAKFTGEDHGNGGCEWRKPAVAIVCCRKV